VAGAEEEVGGAVPDRDDYFVAAVEGGERLVEAAGEAEVAYADGAGGCDHYVCRFQVAVHDPVLVEVVQTVQKLEEDGFDHAGGYGSARWLGVVVDDLQQVVLAVLEDHEDAFVFKNDFDKVDEVWVSKFCAQRHLTDGRL